MRLSIGLIFLILVLLKLGGVINLGWFWILTSFVWVPCGMVLGAILGWVAILLVILGLGVAGFGNE